MKRIIALLLVILAAAGALCGCGRVHEPQDIGGAETAPEGSAEAAAPGATEAAGETPAGETQDTGDEKHYCFDYRCAYNAWSGGKNYIVETDDTVYYLSNNILYFSDKEYTDWMPLCPRPDCKHKNKDCNAYVSSINGIVVYGNYIYYIEDLSPEEDDIGIVRNYTQPALCRMRLDGTQHEQVCRLPLPDTGYAVYENDWRAFNTGKYFIVKNRSFANGTQEISDNYYFILDLDTLETVPVTFNIPYDDLMGFSPYYGDGDTLYCGGELRPQDAEELSDWIKFFAVLDCKTGEFDFIGEMEPWLYLPVGGFGIIDGEFYYTCWEGEMESTVKLFAMDLKTGENRLVAEEGTLTVKWITYDWSSEAWFGLYKRIGEYKEQTRPYWGLYYLNTDLEQTAYYPLDDSVPYEIRNLDYVLIQTQSYVMAIPSSTFAALPEWYFVKADVGTDRFMWRKWEP